MLVHPRHAYERLAAIRNAQAQENPERIRDLTPPQRRRAEERPALADEDAVRLDIRRMRPEVTEAEEEIPVRPTEKLFQPGKVVEGSYGDGKFSTVDGQSGTYYPLRNGMLGFEIDGYKGVMVNQHTAAVFNPSTGEAYSMSVRYDGDKFSLSNVQEVSGMRFKKLQELLF